MIGNFGQLGEGVWNWLNVIHTIMLREVRCRFAGDKLGYFWAFLVPVLWIATLMFFFAILNRTPAIPVDAPTFIATGVIPYVLFRYTVTSMARATSTHRHLVLFGGVRVSDILFSAAILELLNALVIASIIWGIIGMLYGLPTIHDPLKSIEGLILASVFAASVGRLASIAGMISTTVQRVVPVILRPMFWISGIFFTVAELPSNLLPYLVWNPLLHAIETTRSGMFLDYESDFASAQIPLLISATFFLTSYLLQSAYLRSHDGLELT